MKRVIFVFSLLILCAAPARGDLYLVGDIPSKDEIVALWHKLPPAAKKIDVEVREIPMAQMEAEQGARVLAYYQHGYGGRPQIVLGTWPGIGFCFAHEMGHHVWFQAMKDEAQKEFTGIWAANWRRMPRLYAATSPIEAWAECYAMVYGPRPGPEWDWEVLRDGRWQKETPFIPLAVDLEAVIRRMVDAASPNTRVRDNSRRGRARLRARQLDERSRDATRDVREDALQDFGRVGDYSFACHRRDRPQRLHAAR